MKVAAFSLTVCLLGLQTSVVRAQLGKGKPADPRVAALLDRIGCDYHVDSDGDYCLNFGEEGDDKPRLVYINSRTQSLGRLEIREVWSPAFASKTPFPAELLTEMLLDNDRKLVGAWRVLKLPEGYLAVFAVQIAADSDAAALATVLLAVSKSTHCQAVPPADKEASGARPTATRHTAGRLCGW